MLLSEIKKTPDGTYVGVRISKESKDKLYDMAKSMKIPDVLPKKDYHITVIYSRKYIPEFDALGKYDKPIIAKINKFSVFDGSDNKRCLVIELDCDEIVKRHKHIMKLHNAVYDFDVYKCHITLSYDIGTFDFEELNPLDYLKEIEIVEEYSQDLQLDWLANKK